jgi:integrase/recombinase XerD
VQRHVCVLNPATSVKGVKELVIEGKTPEITLEQARPLIRSVETGHVVGLRDRAILATPADTACRAEAVAELRLGEFQHDGTQFVLRLQEKGVKSREIPVRHDLEGYIRTHVDTAGLSGDTKDRPLFRSTLGTTRRLTDRPLTTKDVCGMVKRRLKEAGLPVRLSPHSFRRPWPRASRFRTEHARCGRNPRGSGHPVAMTWGRERTRRRARGEAPDEA